MASEPFEVTDDKGNTVTGTVDVFSRPLSPVKTVGLQLTLLRSRTTVAPTPPSCHNARWRQQY